MNTAVQCATPIWPLATSTWDQEEKAVLHEVIESGSYTMGPRVAQFEREFAAFVGSPYAVMVNSGSSANLLMAQAIKWLRPWPLTQSQIEVGAEIIVPAVAWATSYFPFADLGALRFVDIDPHTLNYDTQALEAAISSNTRVIVAVHVLGNPNEMDLIKTLAPGAIVVEDACESLGATFNGQHVGTFGAMGSYSFFFSHHMSTMEGGMVVTADEELYHALLSLRSHGWTRHLPTPNKLVEKSPDAFNEAFRFILPGFNVRPGELHGATGREQLKKLPGFLAQRRVNARAFQRLMIEHPEIRIQKEVGRSSWFGFSLVVEPWAPFDRADLLKALSEHGIEARPVIAGNFVRQEGMQHLRVVERNPRLPNADVVHDCGCFIGNNPADMTNGLKALEAALEKLEYGFSAPRSVNAGENKPVPDPEATRKGAEAFELLFNGGPRDGETMEWRGNVIEGDTVTVADNRSMRYVVYSISLREGVPQAFFSHMGGAIQL